MWHFPIEHCNGIPAGNHPGAFAAKRKYDVHTGVDLYTQEAEPVYAVEDGVVTKIGIFTGVDIGLDWWEETYAITVRGETGYVNYGEIYKPENINIGDKVTRGQLIAKVKRVLKTDKNDKIPGHEVCMLHVEVYKEEVSDYALWKTGEDKPGNIIDPTPFLLKSNSNVVLLD